MDEVWEGAVREAMIEGDESALRALFGQAVRERGSETASRDWLTAVSALDASAHTG